MFPAFVARGTLFPIPIGFGPNIFSVRESEFMGMRQKLIQSGLFSIGSITPIWESGAKAKTIYLAKMN